MTELVTESRLTHHEATQLTERIKVKVGAIQDNIDHLAALIVRARNGAADEVLGYESWTAYIADTVGFDPNDLTRAERKKLVGFMATEGMPTRAIAPVVGASQKTVDRDIRLLSQNDSVERPATVTSLNGHERLSTQPERPTAPRLPPEPVPERKALNPDAILASLRDEAPDLAAEVDQGETELLDAAAELNDRKAGIRADNFIFGTIIPQLYGLVTEDPEGFWATYDPADNPNAASAHMLFTRASLHRMADQLHTFAELAPEGAA